MRCPICNHETADDSKFCGNCGAKLSGIKKAEENTPAKGQPAETVNTASAGQEALSDNAPLNDNLLSNSNEQPPEIKQQNEPKNFAPYAPQPNITIEFAPKKKSKVPIFAIIAVILVVAVGALYFSGIFNVGPLESIAKASDKTVKSKSFNVNVNMTSKNDNLTLDGTFRMDVASQTIEFYFKVKIPGRDESIVLLLKNNVLILDDGYVDSYGISTYLNKFWNEYDIGSNSDIQWSDILRLMGVDSEKMDFDQFDAVANEFVKNLNDTDYINEKLGTFEKTTENETTNYNFELKSTKLSKELADVFGDSFKLKNENEKAEVKDELYKVFTDSFGSSFNLSFKVKNDYLTGVNFLADNAKIEVEFSDFGKAVIDDSKIEKYNSYLNQPN